jgi:hypothetical protein
MPQENTTHVLYAKGNVKLSSMPHVAIFDVLYAIPLNVNSNGVSKPLNRA